MIGQNSAQRAALLAAAAVRAAAAASSGRAKREFPGGAYPNTYQYGPRAMSPQDFMGSPYSQPGSSGMQSPSAKELSGAMSPMGPNMPRMPFRNTTPSPLNPGSVPSRNSSNSMPYSPAISGDQGGFSSPTYQSQAKGPYGSPSLPRPQSQSGFSAGNRPGSGSDCSRKSDLEQDSKSQVFANSGMQGSSGKLVSNSLVVTLIYLLIDFKVGFFPCHMRLVERSAYDKYPDRVPFCELKNIMMKFMSEFSLSLRTCKPENTSDFNAMEN